MEKFSVQGISFIVTVILARILCPSDYGIVALLLVFINLANVIIDGGLNTALIQKKDATQTDFSTIFWVCIGVSAMTYIAMYIAAPHIAIYYNNENLTLSVRVLSLCLFPYAVNSIQRAYISREMLFKQLFISNFWATICSGIVGILLALNDYGHWALIWFTVSQAMVLACVMWYTIKWRPSLLFSYASFRSLFSFGWKIFLSSLFNSLFINIRSLIIGKMYSPATLAYFERGKQLPSLVMENINTSIQTVLFPAFSKEQDNKDRLRTMVSRSIQTSCLFILPIMMWLIVCAKPIIIFLLTEKWIDTVPYVQLFCIAYMLMPMQIANIEAIKSQGRSDIILKLSIIKIILEVLILAATIQFGPIAITFGIVIYNIICIFINLRPSATLLNYDVKEQILDFLPTLIVTIAMGTITYSINFLSLSNNITLFLQTFVAFVCYFTICYLFKLESFMYLLNTIKSNNKSSIIH